MGYFKKYIRPVLPAICLLTAGLILYFLYAKHNCSLQEAITDTGISILILFVSTWPAIFIIRRYPTRVGVQFYAILPVIVMAITALLLDVYFLRWIFSDHTAYLHWMDQTIWIRLLIAVLMLGWISSAYAMRQKLEHTEAAFYQQADAAALLREAELFKLRQQLHPHFLYNSLNSINALILTQPDKAQEMVGKLSEFLRNSVRREGNEPIPIDEELTHIENYLSIEAIRFGDRLQINYTKQHSHDAMIPPFLLQPIVENAIKFGLYGNTGSVVITLETTTDTMHSIRISNPYTTSTQRPAGTGFGLEGVRRRLYLQFGRTDLLETIREPDQFITILKIPHPHV